MVFFAACTVIGFKFLDQIKAAIVAGIPYNNALDIFGINCLAQAVSLFSGRGWWAFLIVIS